MEQESPEADSGTPESPPGFWSFENLRSLAILIVIIFALRWSVASPYHVPTPSMEPTIKVGDRLLAWKLAYNFKVPFTDRILWEWGLPQRGDIIVFRYPEDPSIDYVKRVIGTPGDEIRIIDDIIYVNGEEQPRSDHNFDVSILDDIYDVKENKLLYREKLNDRDHWVMQNVPNLRHFSRRNWPHSSNGEPYKVPERSVFVMGDNRDNSTDSRVWKEVPFSYIRGQALVVIWSGTWPTVRFQRFGHVLQ